MGEVALNYEKITHLYKGGDLVAHDAWNERPVITCWHLIWSL